MRIARPSIRFLPSAHGDSSRGFTMMELLMAMAIFSMLGLTVVILMRQAMTVFTSGTRGGLLQDRMATTIPQIEHSLKLVSLPASFDPPRAPPTEEDEMAEVEYTPPPPVRTRLRSTYVVMRDTPEGPLKGLPCYFGAWVEDISGKRGDPLLRLAGDRTGPDLRDIAPEEIDQATEDTMFKPSGGAREVCYVAVPEDPDHPAILTLYRGWRSPVGGEETLLEPENLDTLEKVRRRCRKITQGVLHFGITWRRVFAENWDPTSGRVGETEPFVGPIWDSTRALDKTFALYKDETSLGDPSDDIFPAWARLQITLAAPSAVGYKRGETYLADSVGAEVQTIRVANARAITAPGPNDRYLKVDGEWMRYRVSGVNAALGSVRVERGVRNTLAAPHDAEADVYVGLGESRDLRLLFRDRYARKTKRARSGGN